MVAFAGRLGRYTLQFAAPALIIAGLATIAYAWEASRTGGQRLWISPSNLSLDAHAPSPQRLKVFVFNPTLSNLKLSIAPHCGCVHASLARNSLQPLSGSDLDIEIDTKSANGLKASEMINLSVTDGRRNWNEVVAWSLSSL